MRPCNKNRAFVIKELKCGTCGLVMPIPRNAGKNRGEGHRKHMFCPRCGKKKAFFEQGVQ